MAWLRVRRPTPHAHPKPRQWLCVVQHAPAGTSGSAESPHAVAWLHACGCPAKQQLAVKHRCKCRRRTPLTTTAT
eukprot:5123350-Alexandrium_andersonii.AAC.1